jgi:hypothetical protein
LIDVWRELSYFTIEDGLGARTMGFKAESKGFTILARMWRYLETIDEDSSKFLVVE